MKTINAPPKFLIYAIIKAIRHPRTPIVYYVCGCGCRFPNSAKACPKCGDKVEHSPDPKKESPIPWWGSITVILIGVGTAIASGILSMIWLQEVSRALIYIPLGNIFGMSLNR